MKYVIQIFLISILLASCGMPGGSGSFLKPSARDRYKREINDRKPELILWDAAHKTALDQALSIELPYRETGSFSSSPFVAHGYQVSLAAGEKLIVSVKTEDSAQVFIELFDQTGRVVTSSVRGTKVLEHESFEPSQYRLVIQPEILTSSRFIILLNKAPVFALPVAGKGNSAIWSFWGDTRDGGKRKHEGIDIFARKGTPVVASADGTVSGTGHRGLGGKQVWQRTGGVFGHSLYYAHLDSILVQPGDRLKAGDTLGLVGNTGNAAGGAPHLHFGIYRNGAVDPLPFVYYTKRLSMGTFEKREKSDVLKVKSGEINVRLSPDTKSPVLTRINANVAINAIGSAGS